MIRDHEKWRRFTDARLAGDERSPEEKFELMEAMYLHAKRLGSNDSRHHADAIEHKIRLARALNADVRAPSD